MQAFESEPKRKTRCTALHLIQDSSPPTTLCSYRVSPLASKGKTSQHKASASLTLTGPEVPWGVPADKLNTDSLFSNMGEPVQSALHWMCPCVFLRMCACVCVFEQVHRSASLPCPWLLAGWNKPWLPLTPWQRGEQWWRTRKRNFEPLGSPDRNVNSKNMHIYTPDYITLLPQISQSRRLCKKKIPEPISFCDINSANW